MSSRRRVVHGVVPVTLMAVVSGLTWNSGVARAEGAVFDAYAQGIGVQATLTNQSLPLGLVIEGIGPEASSKVTSYGQSDAEASFPYTGTVVPGLFGLGPPLLLGVPGIEYPAQAATGANQPPKDVNFPGVSLHAESGPSSNVALAVVGADGIGGGRSATRIDRDEVGNILATALAQFNTLELGTSLVLSNVRSAISVRADSQTGKLTRSSSFSIGRLTVPGLSFTVPEKSPAQFAPANPLPGVPQSPPVPLPQIPLPFAGQTLPAPDIGLVDGHFTTTLPGFGTQRFAVPAQSILDGFKAAGFELAYQPAVETPTGVQGGVFTVKYTFDRLPDNPYFAGAVPVTYNVGATVASVALTPAQSAAGGVSDGPTTGAETGVDSVGSAPGVAPALGTDLATIGQVPGGEGSLPQVTLNPTTGGSASVERAGTTRSLPLMSDLSNLYFLLVLLVVGQLVVTAVHRIRGVHR